MRLVCWNVNGLRTLKGYQPWYQLPSWEACLETLEADIACFQEVKMTRKQLTHAMCIMDKYEAFYDLHPTKGYAGTVIFVRKDVCKPCAAQCGITGYGPGDVIGTPAQTLQETVDPALFQALDQEGRCVVLDCRLFVLINVYAPNETGPERVAYKMAFYHALEERVRHLIAAGRDVLVVGDMNVVASPVDHCEGALMPPVDFIAHPARQWFRAFLAPSGPLVDVTRTYHPDRMKMYTCWNTLIDARPANYGTRLDYTLATPSLLAWVRDADIQPSIHGSDHCPVYVDFHESISTDQGLVQLPEQLGGTDLTYTIPSMAASQHGAFSIKTQPRLAAMFGAMQERQRIRVGENMGTQAEPTNQSSDTQSRMAVPMPEKRRAKGRPAKSISSQTTLRTFFQKRAPETKVVEAAQHVVKTTPIPSTRSSAQQRAKAKEAWGQLFTPTPPPLCRVHQEPAKSFTVNKPGINQGRKFWVCARPVGPGYEGNKHGSVVDPQYRCDFFAWDSDVRRQRR